MIARRRGRPRIAVDVARAEELRRSGVSQVEASRQLGVSVRTVRRLVLGPWGDSRRALEGSAKFEACR